MEIHDDYTVAEALIDAISGRGHSIVDMFAEDGITVTHAENFAEHGMQTRSAGLILTLSDGAEYMVLVARSR